MGRIILEGFMGSGKSTYGRILSREFLLSYMDTDQEIERREGLSINEIFEKKGEPYFRDLETKLLSYIISENKITDGVISLGGGLPVREENRELLKKCGKVVYIKASSMLLKERLRERRSKRPLLKGEKLDERIDSLLAEREELYLAAADYVIEIDGMEMYQVVNELKLIYRGRLESVRLKNRL